MLRAATLATLVCAVVARRCDDDWQPRSLCQFWAKMGECRRNPDFMLWKCKRSCGMCGSAQLRHVTNGNSGVRPTVTTTSDGCYRKADNYAWKCLQPFERRSGLSESECLSLCKSMSNCQSLIYSAQNGVCDLYTQQIDLSDGYGGHNRGNNGRNYGARFTIRRLHQRRRRSGGYNPTAANCGSPQICPMSGYAYYEKTGQCAGNNGGGTTAAPTTTTTANQCPNGGRPFPIENAATGETETQCLNMPESCRGPGYFVPDQILVGFATKVVTVNTLEECYEACAAETEFTCNSGMFFAVGTENCVLNVETESTQPQQVAEVPDEVDYFEPHC